MSRRATALRAAAWTGVATALLTPELRRRGGLPRGAALAVLASGVPAAAVAVPPGRARGYAVFMAQMWAYLRAFELTYAHPERLARRLRVAEPIAADRALGLGRVPSERLQAGQARSRRRDLLDLVFGAVYFAWALERHAVMLWIARRHPHAFARSAALVGATFDVCWVLFTAFPAAPPWWAGKVGRLPGVRRVTVDASLRLPLVPAANERDDDQGNPWASTPSQHAASAAMVAIVASELDPRAGAAAWGYAGALGLTLVYLGEHYLVDVLGGLAVAAAARAAEPAARRPARQVAAAFDRLCERAWGRRRRRLYRAKRPTFATGRCRRLKGSTTWAIASSAKSAPKSVSCFR